MQIDIIIGIFSISKNREVDIWGYAVGYWDRKKYGSILIVHIDILGLLNRGKPSMC